MDASHSNLPQDGTCWQRAIPNLQQALVAAVANDEIWVANGTYVPTQASVPGNARSQTYLLNRSLQIYGGLLGTEQSLSEPPADPTLIPTILSGDLGVPGQPFDNAYHVVRAESGGAAPTVLLDGVIVRDGFANSSALTGNILDDFGAGMLISNIGAAPVAQVRRCRLEYNDALAGGGGICLIRRTTLEVKLTVYALNSATGVNGRGGGL